MDDSDKVRRILRRSKTIAVVGLSAQWHRPSYFAAKYMQEHGYEMIPVNPGYPEILGEKCYKSLREIPEKVDIVDCFRKSAEIPAIADDAIAIGAKVLWMQLGVENGDARAQGRGGGPGGDGEPLHEDRARPLLRRPRLGGREHEGDLGQAPERPDAIKGGEMEMWLIWLIAGFVLVIAELVTGTFYLLVVGLGAFVARARRVARRQRARAGGARRRRLHRRRDLRAPLARPQPRAASPARAISSIAGRPWCSRAGPTRRAHRPREVPRRLVGRAPRPPRRASRRPEPRSTSRPGRQHARRRLGTAGPLNRHTNNAREEPPCSGRSPSPSSSRSRPRR